MIRILAVLKAISGGLSAGIAALTVAQLDGQVTYSEWITVAVAVAGGFGMVYATPKNRQQPKTFDNPDALNSAMSANTDQHYVAPDSPPNAT